MRSTSTWLLAAAYIIIAAAAQPVGRYVYAEENGAYTLAFDIDEDKRARINFTSPFGSYSEGSYPLVKENSSAYTINFTGRIEGAGYWYLRIGLLYEDYAYQPGDLRTLTFTGRNSLYVIFGGKRLNLVRQAFGVQQGTFIYSSEGLHMNYTIQQIPLLLPFRLLYVQFHCDNTAMPPTPFFLFENNTARPYKSYTLFPPPAGLQRDVSRFCLRDRPLLPNDLSFIVFATEKTITINMIGTYLSLTKVYGVAPNGKYCKKVPLVCKVELTFHGNTFDVSATYGLKKGSAMGIPYTMPNPEVVEIPIKNEAIVKLFNDLKPPVKLEELRSLEYTKNRLKAHTSKGNIAFKKESC
ncbi:hypothetical protein FOL47_010248 [Perkinsus chesapeaki]|uniref:Uncharacterized protein n=1 Tax=Perkinsus chesapeaki TaxID=330153 RepID=A0A7J6MQ07_PERCH|nr:hypothetical protein FOL47_010248 [Perkinsus chesapeaki]